MEDEGREVCLCYHVSLAKLVNFYRRRHPSVASQLNECHNAGGGCGWCVPHLESLFEQLRRGEAPSLAMTPEEYKRRRIEYHKTRKPDLPPPPDAEGTLEIDLEQVLDEVPDDLKLED